MFPRLLRPRFLQPGIGSQAFKRTGDSPGIADLHQQTVLTVIRQTVAALLNGANSDINYGMTDAEVIAAFNAVYPGTKAEYTALKNEFAEDNEHGCPINGKSAPE